MGYLGTGFTHRDIDWCVLYLDWDLQTWLVIETSGIVGRETIPADTGTGTPADRDVIWVDVDAAVSRGSTALTREGLFLIGDFTRAGDFDEPSPGGGTLSAETGVFCGARSPGCCYRTNR